MRAIVFNQFGDPDVLDLRIVEDPEPGLGELLVRVHATSVNPVDTKVRRYGDQYGVEPPIIVGYDVAGTVEAVGDGVDAFSEGDAVFYTPELSAHGSYAELHVTAADIVARKPETLSYEEAAAVPLAACTAYQALLDRCVLQAGQTVLIQGGGGVGHFAVQIAKAAGAFVIVSGNPAMRGALAGDCGADVFVDYTSEDAAEITQDVTDGDGADVIFDTVGGETLAESIPALAEYGRMVTIVGDASGNLGAAYRKNGEAHFLMMERTPARMDAVARLVKRGCIHPIIDSARSLEDAAAAHRDIEAGGVQGKIVLTP